MVRAFSGRRVARSDWLIAMKVDPRSDVPGASCRSPTTTAALDSPGEADGPLQAFDAAPFRWAMSSSATAIIERSPGPSCTDLSTSDSTPSERTFTFL